MRCSNGRDLEADTDNGEQAACDCRQGFRGNLRLAETSRGVDKDIIALHHFPADLELAITEIVIAPVCVITYQFAAQHPNVIPISSVG